MQGRMKQHQLTSEEIGEVLENAQVGHIAAHNENGYPSMPLYCCGTFCRVLRKNMGNRKC